LKQVLNFICEIRGKTYEEKAREKELGGGDKEVYVWTMKAELFNYKGITDSIVGQGEVVPEMLNDVDKALNFLVNQFANEIEFLIEERKEKENVNNRI